ncbi:hypothetical protein [Sutcliffiella halmapala]|uniref:hypothetical protein n=1 Tax=Sutcliffiella halmapala TaxID=79882 RepID=UPI000994B2BA|nr:hypothetical protein [Sutcliffiella halmapala]
MDPKDMNDNCIKLNSGFNNDIYLIPDKGKILRLSKKGKMKEMVRQELEWISFLDENGVIVPSQDIVLVRS